MREIATAWDLTRTARNPQVRDDGRTGVETTAELIQYAVKWVNSRPRVPVFLRIVR